MYVVWCFTSSMPRFQLAWVCLYFVCFYFKWWRSNVEEKLFLLVLVHGLVIVLMGAFLLWQSLIRFQYNGLGLRLIFVWDVTRLNHIFPYLLCFFPNFDFGVSSVFWSNIKIKFVFQILTNLGFEWKKLQVLHIGVLKSAIFDLYKAGTDPEVC